LQEHLGGAIEASGVTAMTGYAMAASGTTISTSDTLNAAIGKLEKMIDELRDYIEQKEMAIAAAITDLDNRLKALE
jgi:outer membrane murein-binding lipoprotein Lpp